MLSLVLILPSSPAYAVSPTLDGTAHCAAGGTNSCLMSLSTTNTNDIIIVVIGCFGAGGCGGFATPTAAGLTFTIQGACVGSDGDTCASVNGFDSLAVYQTLSASALVSESINATQTGNVNAKISAVSFGVSGTYTTSPFDGSGCSNSNPSSGVTSSTFTCNVTTTNPDDLIFGISSSANSGGSQALSVGSGFTFAQCGAASAATPDGDGAACSEYKSVSSTQAGLAVQITSAINEHWAFMALALTADAPVTQPITSTLSGSGSTQSITVSGCSASPTTYSGNGSPHNISVNANCQFTLTLPIGYGFNGMQGPTTIQYTSCASGTCSGISNTYSKQWYSFGTIHGIANSIEIIEPDWTVAIANNSDFHEGASYTAFDYNFTRTPTLNLAKGAIGDGSWWTEHIGCGCGSDQSGGGAAAHRVWHVVISDKNILEVRYNNSAFGATVQPRDNYTMLFYKATNWFVWNVQMKVTVAQTGWNGLDTATSVVVSSPLVAVNGYNGLVISTSTAGAPISQTYEKTSKSYAFSGITETGDSNDSVYEYLVSTNVPFPESNCAASNNGEMKCNFVPQNGAGTSTDITYQPGWLTDVTFVIFGTYNDVYNYGAVTSPETNAVNMGKALYYSSYGNNRGYSSWVLPAYCNISVTPGSGAQGCGGGSNTANGGPISILNTYSWYSQGGVFQLMNQTQLGSPYYVSGANVGLNQVVNGTGTFAPTAASLTNSQNAIAGTLYGITAANLHDVAANLTVLSKPSTNYYVAEYNITILHSTQITSLAYQLTLNGPISGCDSAPNEASSFFRSINSNTRDFEYKDGIYKNWGGFAVGTYGSETHTTGTGVPGLYFTTFSSGCHNRPVVTVSLINNTAPVSYSSGSYSFAIYILPHFGNLTSTGAIATYQTQSITMENEIQMFQKPMNLGNSTEPLALESKTTSETSLLFANSTGSGYDGLVKTTTGTQTRYFLWNATVTGALTNVIGSTSWSQTTLSGGIHNVTVTFTSTGHNLLDFSTTSVTATVNLTCTMSNGAAADTISLSESVGSSLSPTSAPCDGSSHAITVDISITLTATVGSCSPSCEHRFNPAGTLVTTLSITTPSSGSTSWAFHDYMLLTNTYTAHANAQTLFDTGMSCSLTGTIGGNSSSANSIASTAASSDSSSVYFDYNTQATFCSTFSSAPASSQWIKTGTFQFTDTTGGNTHTVQYWKQWTNNFKYSVTHGSPIAPTLTCNQIGSPATLGLTTSNQAFYCDNGATASATNPTTGSGPTERWSDNAQTFTISSGGSTDIFAYFDQLNNNYRATPTNPIAWDAILSITVTGTQFGVAAQTGCTLPTVVNGGAVVCSAWFDYNTQVTIQSPITVNGNERWVQACGAGGNQFTQTTGGNLDNCNYVMELQNTYQASPTSNSNHWDAILAITVTGTQAGVAAQTGCTLTTSSGGGAQSCNVYFDYNTQVTIATPITVSGTEQWAASGTNTFTGTTGGNTNNVNYVRQWLITMASLPLNCGTTAPPLGANFQNDATSFSISESPHAGCSFSTWAGTSGITFGNAGAGSTTATATQAGTITVMFGGRGIPACATLLGDISTTGGAFTLLSVILVVIGSVVVIKLLTGGIGGGGGGAEDSPFAGPPTLQKFLRDFDGGFNSSSGSMTSSMFLFAVIAAAIVVGAYIALDFGSIVATLLGC